MLVGVDRFVGVHYVLNVQMPVVGHRVPNVKRFRALHSSDLILLKSHGPYSCPLRFGLGQRLCLSLYGLFTVILPVIVSVSFYICC